MTEISQELAGRMAALVRDLHADHVEYNLHDRVQDFVARTAAIVAELPAPEDPDLPEARKLAAGANGSYILDDFESGKYDESPAVQWHLAGIKRGRELALSLDAESGK